MTIFVYIMVVDWKKYALLSFQLYSEMIKLSAQNAPNIIQILLEGSNFGSQLYMKKYKYLKYALPEFNHSACNAKCSAYHCGPFSITFNSSTSIFTFRSIIKMLNNNIVPSVYLCQNQIEIPLLNSVLQKAL